MGASAFPKIYALGKVEIQNIFKGEVEVTEKIDGSQFVFGVDEHGEIMIRSKGKVMYLEAYEKMFDKAVEYVAMHQELIKANLPPGTYIYTEYLQKPKHNVLSYDRVPKNHLIVFGVKSGGNFCSEYAQICNFAKLLDLETVPRLYQGEFDMTRVEKGDGGYSYRGYDHLKNIIGTATSVLGGDYGVEGVVAKNYQQHTSIGDPTICCGKYVRESYKERHRKEWKSGGDSVQEFIDSFRSEARWQKAVQHLRERGELEGSPRDIGKLMKEIQVDIAKEEAEEIKQFLYKHYSKQIFRRATAGFAEFYKDTLLKGAFEE